MVKSKTFGQEYYSEILFGVHFQDELGSLQLVTKLIPTCFTSLTITGENIEPAANNTATNMNAEYSQCIFLHSQKRTFRKR